MSASDVLISIMGTDDITKLKSIAKDPMAYWEERRKALFEGEGENASPLHSNQSFLKIFTQQTKERCQHFIKEAEGYLASDRWYKDLNVFEAALCSACPEDDFRHAYVKARAYADLCDKLIFDTTKGKKGINSGLFSSEEKLKQCTKHKIEMTVTKSQERWDKEVLWLFEKNGLFSMWDGLVVMGEGYALGSVFEAPENRDDFCTHSGAVTGHSGSIEHDYSHAAIVAEYVDAFKAFGENFFTFIQECFGENNTNDSVVELCQKVFMAFFTLHDVACNRSTPEDMIFPKTIRRMKDDGFNLMIPVLLCSEEDVLNHNDGAVNRDFVSDELTVDLCAKWRKQYFGEMGRAYICFMQQRLQQQKNLRALFLK